MGEPLKRSVRWLLEIVSERPMNEERITIELSSSQALVLFEFLSRFSEAGKLEVVDQAEERVLWDVLRKLRIHLESAARRRLRCSHSKRPG